MKTAIVYDATTGQILHACPVEPVVDFGDVPDLVAQDYADMATETKAALWPEQDGIESHTALGHVIALLKRFAGYEVLFRDGGLPDRDRVKVVEGRLTPKTEAEVTAGENARQRELIEARIINLDQDQQSAGRQGLTTRAAEIQTLLDAAKAELADLG